MKADVGTEGKEERKRGKERENNHQMQLAQTRNPVETNPWEYLQGKICWLSKTPISHMAYTVLLADPNYGGKTHFSQLARILHCIRALMA